ncbi:MAG TPA: hypothetical protein VGH38_37565 [Bryobacteraceae bacterium]|jgi:hypothetical protein
MTAAIALGVFVLLTFVVFLLHSSQQQREQNSIRRALIEKFGSAQDLGAFLQSEGGRRFIEDLSSGSAGAYGSVLASVQKGIILFLLGLGCCGAASFPNQVAVQMAMGVGLVLLFAGVGFLISAAVTFWLSKSWGLLGRRSNS